MVGVIDTGINPSLAEFSGRIDSRSADVAGGNRGVSDTDGHGTAVSAVIAAAKNDSQIHGVAYNATIVSLRADAPGTCAKEDGCAFYDSAIAAGLDAARLAGAKVINMSLGGSSPNSTLMNAMSRAVNAGIVLVISAGNEGDTPQGINPDSLALVPAQNFPGSVIIAGSIGTATSATQISDFSNRAGTGAQYYLTAFGYRVLTFDHTGQSYLYSGTSFSAPVITGAVALMAQAFPNLTGKQIVDILFATADDLGDPGLDIIYGRGALNITRAFQPIGTTSLANSRIAVGPDTTGELPGAAGDADDVDGKLGVVVLDSYGRAFDMNLGNSLSRAGRDTPLLRAIDGNVSSNQVSAGKISVAMTVAESRRLPGQFDVAQFGIGLDDLNKARLVAASAVARVDRKTAVAFGFSEGAKAMERRLANVDSGAFLIARDVAVEPGFTASRDLSVALRRDLGFAGITIAAENGQVWDTRRLADQHSPYRLGSVTLDRNFGRTWASVGLTRLDEKETLLGARLGAAFGGGGKASTTFLDLEARRDLGSGISLGVSARRGWTSFAGGAFQASAYALDVRKVGLFNSGDSIGLRVSQPLRIEQGGLSLLLPTGYDYGTGEALMTRETLSLSPSGREVDAEVSYSTGLFGGWLSGNMYLRRQPGHIASADNEVGAAVRYRVKF